MSLSVQSAVDVNNLTAPQVPVFSTAATYADSSFAVAGMTLTNSVNTFTAVAKDTYGRSDTNSITVNLPATPSFQYDGNGNLTSDGTRTFDYDDENQLIRMTVTNAWKSEFVYDGQGRRRIRREYAGIGISEWGSMNDAQPAPVKVTCSYECNYKFPGLPVRKSSVTVGGTRSTVGYKH